MHAYLVLRFVVGLLALFAHVRDFRDDSAAFPIVMSARLIAITGGTENSHCSATGDLPGGESIVTENTPRVLRSVCDGATRKDWANKILAEIKTKIMHLGRN